MEHHANIVPWHMLAAERGIELRWIPLTADGQLDLTDLDRLLDGAKAFAFTAMSNVLGTLTPGRRAVRAPPTTPARWPIVDACQYVPHNVTDVQAWDADFVAFSSHKMCGPSGIGALWGRAELLDAMPPFLGGGNMIADVRLDGFTPAPVPAKFEAGTPPITEAIGFGAAVDFLESLGMDAVRRHEMELTGYALDTLNDRFGDDITIHGPDNVEVRGGVLSFAFRDLHPHDVSQVLDQRNVCVRAGHHCAKPLMRVLGVAPRPGPASTCTTTATTSTRSPMRSTAPPTSSASDDRTRSTTMPGLEDLYREIILDHYRTPRNRGELPTPPAVVAQGHNPLCGDEITVYLQVDDDVVSDVKVGGQGCSISQTRRR